jgi:tRNA threonylcarbamoyladenosine biosynthesis protein TsaB
MAGVAPAASDETGEDISGLRCGEPIGPSITLSQQVLVLSLDTTTRAGSVAVVRDDQVLSEIVGDASRTHGERLPGDLVRALDAASVPVDAVELLAVAAGPGSFTGLRVGIAAMQGLAMATGLRIVAVSALDALARIGADGKTPIAAWIDAQRGEVFAALYDAKGDHAVAESVVSAPQHVLESWAAVAPKPARFIGDGAERYASTIRDRLGGSAQILGAPALAGAIGRMAAAAPERAVLPHAVVPIYIRKPDAELARAKSREQHDG